MNKQIQELFRKDTTRVKSISFHPNQPTFITGNHCGTIYIWNYHYRQITSTLREHVGSVRAIKFHPTGEYFASAGDDKILRVWNYKTRQVIHSFKGHTDYIRTVDFHPTHPWVISGSDDCTIKVWNYYTGEQLCSSSGHHHYVMSALFIDSTHIITSSLDHTVGLWNCTNLFDKNKKFMVPDIILYQTIDAHERGINTLFMHENIILSGSDDREVKVWKYKNEVLTVEKTLYGQEGNVTGVYVTSDVYHVSSEDGTLTTYQNGVSSQIQLKTRAWCVNGKDGYLAVGTDDGLIMYRLGGSILCTGDENKAYYITDDCIRYSDYITNKDFYKITKKVEGIQIIDSKENQLLIQFEDKYEIIVNSRKTESDYGKAAFVGDNLYKIQNKVLFKNGVEIGEADGRLISSTLGIFIVNLKQVRFYDNSGLFRKYFCNFEIKNIKCSKSEIAIFGFDKIVILDSAFNLKYSISELVEITGGLFYADYFIYATIKQIKYLYKEVGILQSNDMYVVPLKMEGEDLFYWSSVGIEKMHLNLGEITFRRAVENDDNILSVIETEQLPGLSPLEYLIRMNKGAIALPYIKDEQKRFSLFLSDSNFASAFELCNNKKMYEELGFKALKENDIEYAEMCFKQNKDFKNLYYLYLFSKQFEKLKELDNEEINDMVKLVLEDKTVLGFISDRDGSDKDGSDKDGSDRNGSDKNGSNKNGKQPISKISNINKNISNMNIKCKTTQLYATSEYIESSSENETNSSRKTNCAVMNDSDCNMHIYDSNLLKEINPDSDNSIETALKLVTDGKFPEAIEIFRNCIANIAHLLKTPDDHLEIRRKIGAYLWGLHFEIIRKLENSISKNINLSSFFLSLKLENIHLIKAANSALNLNLLNKNFKTAKKIAENLCKLNSEAKLQKNVKRALQSNQDDLFTFKEGDLCYDSCEVEETNKQCALCFVKFKEGEICAACRIGVLE